MCVIIAKPSGETVPIDVLDRCARNNADGWGVMYADNGKVIVHRGLVRQTFFDLYKEIEDLELGIHFRQRTHGDYSLDNCHPYEVLTLDRHGIDMFLMHNGVIKMNEVNKRMSDTWHFVEHSFRPIVAKCPDLIYTEEFLRMLEVCLGWSRLLILDSSGKFSFVNKKEWHEKDNVLFSNAYSLTREPTVHSGLYGGYFEDIGGLDDDRSYAIPVGFSGAAAGIAAHSKDAQSSSNGASVSVSLPEKTGVSGSEIVTVTKQRAKVTAWVEQGEKRGASVPVSHGQKPATLAPVPGFSDEQAPPDPYGEEDYEEDPQGPPHGYLTYDNLTRLRDSDIWHLIEEWPEVVFEFLADLRDTGNIPQ